MSLSLDRSVRRSLSALASAYFAMGASALAVIGSIRAIADGLGIGTGAVAHLVAIYAIVFAVTAPLLQVIASRLPQRTLLLAGLAASAAGSLASALATGYASLFAARILVAVGGAAIAPVASALGAAQVPREQQGSALVRVFSGMTVASIVSTPAAQWISSQFGWRFLFCAIGLLNLAVAAAVALWVKDGRRGQALSLRSMMAELRRPGIAPAIAVIFAYMAGMFASFTMIVPILQNHFGIAPRWTSSALLVFGLAGLGGNVLARRLATRFDADRLIALALAVLIAMFAAMDLLPGRPIVALAALLVWACSHDVFMPSQQRRMAEIAPHARSLALALNSSALYVGMSAGSYAAGVLATRLGTGELPLVSAAVLALALLALWMSRRSLVDAVPTAHVELREVAQHHDIHDPSPPSDPLGGNSCRSRL